MLNEEIKNRGKGLQERSLENSPYFAGEIIEPLTVEVLSTVSRLWNTG